ncbi:MAG: GIY-YIG nuclease family protein [Anaerolineae bacterium]|nr:GIY-YIG nuclease family protein [Anaerolineae bacterium]
MGRHVGGRPAGPAARRITNDRLARLALVGAGILDTRHQPVGAGPPRYLRRPAHLRHRQRARRPLSRSDRAGVDGGGQRGSLGSGDTVAAPGLSLSSEPGTYALLLSLSHPLPLTVGKLGRFDFPAGVYVYVGSARGPGGLSARLARHLRHPKPLHWHIDYLRAACQPLAVWTVEDEQPRECAWATAVARLPGASQPAPGFGASDCRCPTHLFHFPTPPSLARFREIIGSGNCSAYASQLPFLPQKGEVGVLRAAKPPAPPPSSPFDAPDG